MDKCSVLQGNLKDSRPAEVMPDLADAEKSVETQFLLFHLDFRSLYHLNLMKQTTIPNFKCAQ